MLDARMGVSSQDSICTRGVDGPSTGRAICGPGLEIYLVIRVGSKMNRPGYAGPSQNVQACVVSS